MGRGIGQGARPTNHSRIGKREGTQTKARQFNQQPHPPLPKNERSPMNLPKLRDQYLRKIRTQPGFLAALDQSGGSTPKALVAYGIKEGSWSNDEQMFTLVHEMRAR